MKKPTAAVAPDDVKLRVYPECSAAAACRIPKDIGKTDTSAGYPPPPCAAANDPRASTRRGALAWPVHSVQQSRTLERTCLRTRQRLKNPSDGSRSSAPE